MFQLLTTEEFADWFAGLADAAAEEVATALEVVAQLGPSQEAPDSSEWLLWYEYPGWYEHVALPCPGLPHPGLIERFTFFRARVLRWIEHLNSPRFTARLRRLNASDASRVATALEGLKRLAGVRRFELHTSPGRVSPRAFGREVYDDARRLYLEALSAARLEVGDFPAHTSALRELMMRSSRPAMRLLYGVSVERDAGLFILGERLDRSFYGDSVRRAERTWQSFLQGELSAVEPAPIR